MTRSKVLPVVMGMALWLSAAQMALAASEGEVACCGFMNDMAQKYFQKHVKIANKCTLKMEASSDPNGEKCDDEFDVNTGGIDFVIDKFHAKFFKRMKKKCIKKIEGVTEANFAFAAPVPSCGCNAETSLQGHIECKLEQMSPPADTGVCGITPKRKNANRGTLSPPDLSGFCP